jgi:superfamily I DNA/RNA helicase
LTSFEGSKGLSAQHVFILGLQEHELPRDKANITDLEICKYIVALTRTRKQCQLLYTWRFSGKPKRPSEFIDWIHPQRREAIKVDKNYWKKLEAVK